jgi:hypothetical protein
VGENPAGLVHDQILRLLYHSLYGMQCGTGSTPQAVAKTPSELSHLAIATGLTVHPEEVTKPHRSGPRNVAQRLAANIPAQTFRKQQSGPAD